MPRTINGLFDRVISEENLTEAALELFTGARRFKPDVLAISADLLGVVQRLHAQLAADTWTPQPYTRFIAHNDVKRRVVHAPAAVDRIVHHAIVRVVHQLFIDRFIHDSYAVIPGKGNQRAAVRLMHFLSGAQHAVPDGRVYVLKADVHQFYPNMDHEVLMCLVSRVIRDRRLLDLWRRCIAGFSMYRSGVGLPVGSYLSQLSANVYLNPLDHLMKDRLRLHRYLRYIMHKLVKRRSHC